MSPPADTWTPPVHHYDGTCPDDQGVLHEVTAVGDATIRYVCSVCGKYWIELAGSNGTAIVERTFTPLSMREALKKPQPTKGRTPSPFALRRMSS